MDKSLQYIIGFIASMLLINLLLFLLFDNQPSIATDNPLQQAIENRLLPISYVQTSQPSISKITLNSNILSLHPDPKKNDNSVALFINNIELFERNIDLNNNSFLIKTHSNCSTLSINKAINNFPNTKNMSFTLIMPTYRREKCVFESIKHYLQCDDIAQIRIVWNDDNNISDSLYALQQNEEHKDRLFFHEYKDNKLTNRWIYHSDFVTEAVFQSDDDQLWSCQLLSNTFKLWQQIPDYLVSYVPRLPFHSHLNKAATKPNYTGLFYRWYTAYTQCQYRLSFSGGCMMHKKYYQLYHNKDNLNGIEKWNNIKQYVDGNVTAEDITMSLLYTYVSSLPPIAISVPSSEFNWRYHTTCKSMGKRKEMHQNKNWKRTSIFGDTLKVLKYFDENSEFRIPMSTLWVDVMSKNTSAMLQL